MSILAGLIVSLAVVGLAIGVYRLFNDLFD